MTFSRRNAIIGAAATGGIALAASLADAQEKHPEIRRAIRALEAAKGDLNHAAHDFGGHRADALRACDEAISQLNICLKYP